MQTPYSRLSPIEPHPNPIDPRTDIGHVHLKTADIQKVYDFYVGILGFEVIARMPNALFIAAGNYHHHLAFNTWESANGPKPPFGTTGLYHVALRYPDRPALGDALQRLVKANWPLEGVSDHGTHEAIYLNDPDGNGLELYYDRPETEWAIDDQGHLKFDNSPLDLDGLLAAAKPYSKS